MEPSDLKICTKCNERLSVKLFRKDKRTSDGLAYRCKNCVKKYLKGWASGLKHREMTHNVFSMEDGYIGPKQHRECVSCKQYIDLRSFSRLETSLSGRGDRCLPCAAKKRLDYYNSDSPAAVAARRRYADQLVSDPAHMMLIQARHRAKKKGKEFTISKEDIAVPKLCPVFGIPMVVGSGVGFKGTPLSEFGGAADSPSLDRIDSSKGYIPGNVKVISLRANLRKGDATIEELELILAYMRANLPAQQPESQPEA